jgi:predicted hydrocarbon binding protein
MEKLLEDLERDLKNVLEGKEVKQKRRDLGDKVDIRLCRMIVYALQWASVGYQSALRFAGMKLGKRIGEGSEKTELSLVLEEIKKIIEYLRGGRVEIEIMPEVKGAQLKIYDSYLTSGIPNILQNLCFFEEGFIEGYLDGVIAKNGSLAVASQGISVLGVTCQEIRCVGLGDKFCGFLIKFS